MELGKFGDDLLSRFYAVPLALMGLTSLFGMGRGGPHRYRHLKLLVVSRKYLVVRLTHTIIDTTPYKLDYFISKITKCPLMYYLC